MTDNRKIEDRAVGVAVVDASLALPTCRPRGRAGRTAASSFDEDIVTLGATALLDLLDRHPGSRPTALLLATTSSPLAEGGVAQEIAEITGLAGPDLHVAEQGGTVCAGLGILIHAVGSLATLGGPVAIVVADDRRDTKGRPLGAGALAMLVADHGNVGRLEWVSSAGNVIRDHWRAGNEAGLRDGDRSLAAVGPDTAEVPIATTMVEAGPRAPHLEGAGLLGCAGPLTAALLAAGDVVADPGSRVRVRCRAGGVSHVVDLLPGTAAAAVADRLRSELAGGREQAPTSVQQTDGFAPFTSGPRAWRERAQDLQLEGQRDAATGEMVFPPVPEAAAEGLTRRCLARRGAVLTMTTDRVFPYGGPVQMVVVALDDGGRFYGQAVPESPPIRIDDRVTLVPRSLYTTDGLAQRYWKVAPQPAGHDDATPSTED